MTSTLSSRDLSFFTTGSVFPQDSLPNQFLGLVTSTNEISSVWLVQSLALNLITSKIPVAIVSFHNRRDVYSKGLRKLGVDLAQVNYIDVSANLFTISPANKGFKPVDLDDLFKVIQQLLSWNDSDGVILIDNVDLLLSTDFYEPSKVIELIHKLQRLSRGLYIFAQADEPILNDQKVMDYSSFLNELAFESGLIISCRPFETGRASDVTGVLRISRGPKPFSGDSKVVEQQMLYHVGPDSSITLRPR